MNKLEYQKVYHEAYSSFIRMMDKELDNAGCKYADQYANRILSEKEKEKEKGQYPFQEGDDYWTIEGGGVVWSCWDYVSEALHDKNPNQVYYKSREEAVKQLNK